jgi:hypothetical protein
MIYLISPVSFGDSREYHPPFIGKKEKIAAWPVIERKNLARINLRRGRLQNTPTPQQENPSLNFRQRVIS